jgi:hypothetical protein
MRPQRPEVREYAGRFLKNPQVTAVSDPQQRLKRPKFPIYDTHAHTRAHIVVLIYPELGSLGSLIHQEDLIDLGFLTSD